MILFARWLLNFVGLRDELYFIYIFINKLNINGYLLILVPPEGKTNSKIFLSLGRMFDVDGGASYWQSDGSARSHWVR